MAYNSLGQLGANLEGTALPAQDLDHQPKAACFLGGNFWKAVRARCFCTEH